MKPKWNFIGNTSIYLIANIINAGIPFLLLPILTRELNPEEYGLAGIYILAVTILNAFTGLSSNGAISVRYFQLNRAEFSRYITSCFVILLGSLFFLIFLLIILPPIIIHYISLSKEWIFLAIIVACTQFALTTRLSVLQVSGKPYSYGAILILNTLISSFFSIFFILDMNMGWEGRAYGYSISLIILGAISLVWLNRDGLLIKKNNIHSYVCNSLKFGLPLIPHTIGSLIAITADRFIIANRLDLSSAGIYILAIQIGQILVLLTDSFNKTYAPWLFNNLANSTLDLKKKIVKNTYLYFIAILSIAFISSKILPIVLIYVIGGEYNKVYELIGYILMGYAFGGCYYMVTNFLFYENKTVWLASATFLSGMLSILLTFILIEINGLIGAAQAFMISQAIIFFLTWWLANMAHPMPWLRNQQ